MDDKEIIVPFTFENTTNDTRGSGEYQIEVDHSNITIVVDAGF